MWSFLASMWPKSLRIFAVLVAITRFDTALLAVDPAKSVYQLNCQSWSRSNGLGADNVRAVAQSPDGYIWLGTSCGLIRFDGTEFKEFPFGVGGANHEAVSAISQAGDGKVWIAFSAGGFGNYDHNYKGVPSAAPNDASEAPSSSILVAGDGAIWKGTMTGWRRSIDGRVTDESQPAKAIPVTSLSEDASGRIWIGTMGAGFSYWARGKLKPIPNPELEKLTVLSVATDLAGDIWVATSKGLYRYGPGLLLKKILLAESRVNALLVDSHGVIWAGTEAKGLGRFQDGGFTMLGKSDGLGSEWVNSILEDAEGSIWVGTAGGLSQISEVRFPIFSAREGFIAASALAVSAAPKGGLWISTLEGATYYDGRTPKNFQQSAHFPSDYLCRVLVARNGDVYFTDIEKNIIVLAKAGSVVVYPTSIWAESLSEDDTSVLVGLGSTLVRLKDDKIVPYPFTGPTPFFDWIYSVFAARNGTIWVGTNHGLFRVRDGKYREWSTTEGLLSNQVASLSEDSSGDIWGTTTWGIFRIHNDELTLIGETEGLSDSRVYAVVPDDHGYLWLDSGRGIQRVSKQSVSDLAEGKTKRIDCQMFEEMESIKFVGRDRQAYVGCRTTDGRIWFPSPHGVIMIDPVNFFRNRVAPRISVAAVESGDRTYTDHLHSEARVGTQRVTFLFSALGFVAPKKIRARYQLVPFDPDWIEAGSARTASYGHLKPGHYSFRVQAANEDGVWNTEGGTFNIDLIPPFFQSPWFYSIITAAVTLAALRLNGRRIRSTRQREVKLRSENALLESKVALRTVELNNSVSELRTSEQRFKAIFEQAAVGVAQISLETGRLEQANEHFCHIMGRSREELSRLTMAEIVDPEELPIHLEKMARLRSGESRESTREGRYVRKDGSQIWVNMTLSAMWRPGEAPDYVIAVAQDVSKRKRLEEHLRQSQKMDAIGTLAAGIAHDFNNILTVISGYTDLALLEAHGNPKACQNLEAIKLASGRATDLVRQILTFSRQHPLERRPISLIPIVTETLKLLRATIPSSVEFRWTFTKDVPTVLADATQVHQIVMNLGTNAWQAMKGGGRLEVKLERCVIDAAYAAMQPGLRPGVYACLSISDSGCGMDPMTLGRIFEPFFTTKAAGGGTGLGLAVVHGIMDSHDGSIGAYSSPGEGTAFKLYFPEFVGEPVVDILKETKVPRGSGERILFVDDEEMLVTLGELALSGLGYTVETATRPELALAMAKADGARYSLVITDQTMPGMTGLVLAQRIREIQPGLPVILMTGNNISITPEMLNEAGITQVLLKPHSLQVLGAAVHQAIRASQPLGITDNPQAVAQI